MAINFINNYPENSLKTSIKQKNGDPLFGEIWVYNQFIEFKNNDFVDKKWYFKHDYNLSRHPGSKSKVEGQIDFLLLNENGLLVIEVKGGSIAVENDVYYSLKGDDKYEAQNPFVQSKEYVNTLKDLIGNPRLFVYKAIVFPHELHFELIGPQLSGYKYCFFSKRNYQAKETDYAINKVFFEFIDGLAKASRINILKELYPKWDNEKINNAIWEKYPKLKSDEIERIKRELFPNQQAYGDDPNRINEEIILKENYEILKGLRKNKKVIVQGKPGSGKTVLARKFIAEQYLMEQRGVLFCANKLVKSKLRHLLITEHQLDSNFLDFETYYKPKEKIDSKEKIDFIVFDEAQEYFDDGLFELIEYINNKFSDPKILILYDSYQTIKADFKDILFFEDFFIQSGYSHYYFDENYRCIQSKFIFEISEIVRNGVFNRLQKKYTDYIISIERLADAIKAVNSFINDSRFLSKEKVILIDSSLEKDLNKFFSDYFKKEIEELTEENINISNSKIKYTTPIRYRGLENKYVLCITNEVSEKTKRQLYIGITRAVSDLNIALWKI
jgi:GTPase SAR1 family protein